MKADVVTIFPQMFEKPLAEGLLGRATNSGLLDVRVHDLRDFCDDRHRVVDDVPYGGGPGMVFKPEPLFRAVDWIETHRGEPSAVILTSPQGRRFSHAEAERLSRLSHIVILCGRYEGIDERVKDRIATDEVSIGDYVLSGGELASMVLLDAVTRLLPGAVGDERSVGADSFVRGLLDCPHYTRPAVFRGFEVPEVLMSGHHGEIRRWRKHAAVRRTLERRPDLLPNAVLDDEEREILRELIKKRGKGVT